MADRQKQLQPAYNDLLVFCIERRRRGAVPLDGDSRQGRVPKERQYLLTIFQNFHERYGADENTDRISAIIRRTSLISRDRRMQSRGAKQRRQLRAGF